MNNMRGKGEWTWMEQSVNRLRVTTDWFSSSNSVYLHSFILYKAQDFSGIIPSETESASKKVFSGKSEGRI